MGSYGNDGAAPGGGVFSMFGSAAQHLQDAPGPSTSSQSDYNPFLDPNRGFGGGGGLAAQEVAADAKELDLVFIMDATGSMGSYIASATKNIETICDNIIQSEQLSSPGALRVGLVAFRDHPPQDYSYITKEFPFTSDVTEIKEHLKTLYATGGGDGPEAVTAAMKAVLDLQWRPTATRLAVLIADAPPHGIGEYGDGFPNGSPEGSDPLVLARLMAQAGISLFMVACEPALSAYSHAADFYQGIVRITSGLLVPLTTASLLTHVIIAAASEAMALDRLHREVGDEVAERLRTLSLEGQQQQQQQQQQQSSANNLMDEVARDLHQRLLLRNESTKQLVIESIYRESEESRHNIEVWSTARDLPSAKPLIKKVHGSRLSDSYLQTRRAKSSFTTGAAFPSSPSHSRIAAGGPSSWNSLTGSSPAKRTVISDFSAFTGATGLSVGSPPSASTAAATFSHSPDGAVGGGMRGPSFSSPSQPQRHQQGRSRGRGRGDMSDDDDDDDDDDEQERPLPIAVESREEYGALEVAGEDGSKLRFRQGAISLDQARRLAMQSAYRGGLA